FAVDPADLAVGQHGGGVVDVLGPHGEPDDGDDAGRLRRQPVDGAAGVGEEVLLEQEVLGWIAGDRQLGEDDQLGVLMAGAGDVLLGLGDIPARSPTVVSICARAMRSGGATPRLWLGASPDPVLGERGQAWVAGRAD